MTLRSWSLSIVFHAAVSTTVLVSCGCPSIALLSLAMMCVSCRVVSGVFVIAEFCVFGLKQYCDIKHVLLSV